MLRGLYGAAIGDTFLSARQGLRLKSPADEEKSMG